MLKFIFGRAGCGKTCNIIKMTAEAVGRGQRPVLIVPEQFSFESERAVLKALGDSAAQSVTVTTFSRLCDEVGRMKGGSAGETLNDADKVIFMNRALRLIGDDLKLWSRYHGSVAFAKTMLDTVGEFKINAVTPGELRHAAECTENGNLAAKLIDTALIYETYDAVMGEKFIDPADMLTKLYRQLEDCDYFNGRPVFIDSFKGFTGQQFKIIDRILSRAESLTVGLTNDPAADKEYNIFSNIRLAAEKITRSARRHGVTCAEPLVLSENRYLSPGMKALETLISGGVPETAENADGITVCAAATYADEAEFAARNIRRLVRENNMRYRDFVVICRDTETYEEQFAAACERNGIPCFYDKRVPLSAFPQVSAVSAAADAATSFGRESVLRFHKTGLGTLTADETAALENYMFLWNIDGKMLENEWTTDPRGFVSEPLGKAEEDELKRINTLREKAIKPLLEFKEEFSGTAADMAAAAVRLLEKCGAAEKLKDMAGRFKNCGAAFSAEALKLSYDKYMSLLDSMALCFGGENIKKTDFCEALKLSVSLESVGVIPRMLDEVTFGAADRIRPSRPRVAFILGANQGVFPRGVQCGGIFGAGERRALIDLGVEIPDNSVSSVTDEDYLVYCNLCCPSDRLFISYACNTLSGEPLEPSAFVAEIRETLRCAEVSEPDSALSAVNLPETKEDAYTQYCLRRLKPNFGGAELKAALLKTDFAEKTEKTGTAPWSEREPLPTDTARELYGEKIAMSASKFETFRKCHFSFFCRYGLRAEKLKPAEFDVLQRGTVVHYVLERIVGKYKKGICSLSGDELDKLVDKYISEYLDGITGYRSVETKRAEFLVSRISRSLKDVVRQLAREFAQSDFEPVGCEVKIGGEGDIPALNIPFEGGEVSITGSIDRVDKYGAYIRVIDYKTGSRKFKLPDVLFGLNMQMLIYLYAVTRAAGNDDEKAAGILYMPSKRDLNDEGMAMNGLLRGEKELVSAMDREMNGEFVPKLTLTKSGSISRRCTSFASAEDFSRIFDYIEKLMRDTGSEILSGKIDRDPLDGRETPACKYCDFKSVCGREDEPSRRVPDLKNDEVFEKMRGEKEDGV